MQVLSLEELCLNDTQLEFIPANIGRLINLKVLELRDNKISQIPKAISHLMKLYRLDIGQNNFIDFVRTLTYYIIHTFWSTKVIHKIIFSISLLQ